ncbi:hypothetical protein EYR38_005018 [Pleurotus pulmonarius]|nr:hypothetical protein EYR38_005018 [Pleurotus pulmonarius]
MKNAPHIRPLIEEINIHYDLTYVDDPEDNAIELDDADIKGFIRGFTRLHTLFCRGFVLLDIPLVLPTSSITTLYIQDRSFDAHELYMLLEASASVVRSLTLDDVIAHRPTAVDISQMPAINMEALEELFLIRFDGLLPTKLRTQRLKILWCKDWYDTLRDALPDSLVTLAITEDWGSSLRTFRHFLTYIVFCLDYTGSDDQRQFSTENLSVAWGHRSSSLEAITNLITKFALPYKIRHLEVMLSSEGTLRWGTSPIDLGIVDHFEAFILNLHNNGSLRKLTFTIEPTYWRIRGGVGVVDRFSKLTPLGIFDFRVDSRSVLDPQHRIAPWP